MTVMLPLRLLGYALIGLASGGLVALIHLGPVTEGLPQGEQAVNTQINLSRQLVSNDTFSLSTELLQVGIAPRIFTSSLGMGLGLVLLFMFGLLCLYIRRRLAQGRSRIF